MRTSIKRTVIRLATWPPLFGLMNRVFNTAPIIFALHRPMRLESGIYGYDNGMISQYLAFLIRHRYHIITVDAIEAWMHGENDSDMINTVAFTFDDGYQDQADLIREVFVPMGVPANMFLITDFVDGKTWPWDAKINWLIWNAPRKLIKMTVGKAELKLDLDGDEQQRRHASRMFRNIVKYLKPGEMRRAIDVLAAAVEISLPAVPPACHQPIAWDEARTLESQGVRFGSHSVNHYVFSSLDYDEAVRQLRDSRQRLLAELKYPLATFCYPVGGNEDYTGRELLALPEAGYRLAVTMSPGTVQKPLCQAKQEQYSINRYSLPEVIEDFFQQISWIERIKDEFRKLSPMNYITAFYGSKSGLAQAFRVTVNYRLGKYKKYKQVNWLKVKRLVFVCKGNVCRSPFAESVAKQCGLPAASYGLVTNPGTAVNPIASRIALQLGVDMTEHRTKKFNVEELEDGDLIIGMEPSHCESHWYAGVRVDVQFALLGLLKSVNKKPYLHDPYGLSESYYYYCLSYIQRTVSAILISTRVNIGA